MYIAPVTPGLVAMPRSNPMQSRRAPMGHPSLGQPRFGIIDWAAIAAMGMVVSMFGSMFGGIIVSETKWNKSRMQLNSWLQTMKTSSIHRLSEPEIQEKDGKQVKRYDVRIGYQQFVVTEVYEKPAAKTEFVAKPSMPKILSFKMEAVKGSLKTKSKPVFKFDLQTDNKGRPVKVVQYADDTVTYVTTRKRHVKKLEEVMRLLHANSAEAQVNHVLDGTVALPETAKPVENEAIKINGNPEAMLDDDAILEILDPDGKSLYAIDIEDDDVRSQVLRDLDKYSDAPPETRKNNWKRFLR